MIFFILNTNSFMNKCKHTFLITSLLSVKTSNFFLKHDVIISMEHNSTQQYWEHNGTQQNWAPRNTLNF